MKYFIIFVLVITIRPGVIYAQCCDPSASWTEVIYSFTGALFSRRYTFSDDTTYFNDKPYFQILTSTNPEGGNWEETYRYFRSDSGRINQGYDSGEIVWADFTLSVGDTFTSNWVEMIVTNIDSILLENGKKTKRLELHCEAWGDYPVFWIEDIGISTGLYWGESTCAADGGSTMLCFWQNDILLYKDPVEDTCWLLTTSTNMLTSRNVTIYPNPVTDNLQISDPEKLLSSLSITGSDGKQYYNGDDTPISTAHFPSGLYIVEIIQKNGSRYIQKLIRQ